MDSSSAEKGTFVKIIGSKYKEESMPWESYSSSLYFLKDTFKKLYAEWSSYKVSQRKRNILSSGYVNERIFWISWITLSSIKNVGVTKTPSNLAFTHNSVTEVSHINNNPCQQTFKVMNNYTILVLCRLMVVVERLLM